jgi:hypothetical protein
MNLAQAIECYGTSEGVEKSWDTRREMVLYHGTTSDAAVHILKNGLIPKAVTHRKKFGTFYPDWHSAIGWIHRKKIPPKRIISVTHIKKDKKSITLEQIANIS